LVIVKESREDNEALESFILSNVPNSKKVSEVSSEATYLLPKDSSAYFSEFFQKFDEQLKSLGVSSYGVSMTTLEEVFLRVESGNNYDDIKAAQELQRKLSMEDHAIRDEYSIAKEQRTGA
jgi:ATP-binding cassette subfamily A (ABC1) protein 3